MVSKLAFSQHKRQMSDIWRNKIDILSKKCVLNIQSFSLTEYIGIVGVRKFLGCVCVCVCLCVCRQPCAVTTKPISTKLCRNGPPWVQFCAFEFWLINIIDDVTAAILIGKMVALSRPQFCSEILEIWCVGTLAKC